MSKSPESVEVNLPPQNEREAEDQTPYLVLGMEDGAGIWRRSYFKYHVEQRRVDIPDKGQEWWTEANTENQLTGYHEHRGVEIEKYENEGWKKLEKEQ